MTSIRNKTVIIEVLFYIQRASIVSAVRQMSGVTHSFREVHLVQLNEACILHALMETLAAQVEAYFRIKPSQYEQTWQEQEPWPNFLG